MTESKSTVRRFSRIKKAMIIGAAAAVITGFGAVPAQARTVISFERYNWVAPQATVTVGPVTVGAGQPLSRVTLILDGEGTHINELKSSFGPATFPGLMPIAVTKLVCNWRVDYLFYDADGNRYTTYYGGNGWEDKGNKVGGPCTPFGEGDTLTNIDPKPGRVCVKILSEGKMLQDNHNPEDEDGHLKTCLSIVA